MRTNAVRQPKCTGSFHTSSHILDLRPLITRQLHAVIDLVEELPRKHFETCDNSFSSQILDGLKGTCFWSLYLKRTLSKIERQHFGDKMGHLCFENDILTSDTEIDVSFANEGRNVCSW